MNTGDKIALITLIVTVLACVASWLVVPGFRRWASKRKRVIAIGAVFLVGSVILWLHNGRQPEQPKQAPSQLSGPDVQTSFGKDSPNIKSSGNGAVTVQIGTAPTQTPMKPDGKKK